MEEKYSRDEELLDAEITDIAGRVEREAVGACSGELVQVAGLGDAVGEDEHPAVSECNPWALPDDIRGQERLELFRRELTPECPELEASGVLEQATKQLWITGLRGVSYRRD